MAKSFEDTSYKGKGKSYIFSIQKAFRIAKYLKQVISIIHLKSTKD